MKLFPSRHFHAFALILSLLSNKGVLVSGDDDCNESPPEGVTLSLMNPYCNRGSDSCIVNLSPGFVEAAFEDDPSEGSELALMLAPDASFGGARTCLRASVPGFAEVFTGKTTKSSKKCKSPKETKSPKESKSPKETKSPKDSKPPKKDKSSKKGSKTRRERRRLKSSKKGGQETERLWFGECFDPDNTFIGEITLIISNGYLFGSLTDRTDGYHYKIGIDGNGAQIISSFPFADIDEFAETLDPPIPEDPINDVRQLSGNIMGDVSSDIVSRNKEGLRGQIAKAKRRLVPIDFIDVMFVWTTKAECQNALGTASCTQTVTTRAALLGLIELAIANTNIAFANSGIFAQMRVAYAYNNPGYDESNKSSGEILRDVTFSGNELDEVQWIRSFHQADMVAIVTGDFAGPNVCGVAWLLTSSVRPTYTFSMNKYSCLSGRVLQHEKGHNFGCRHDRANAHGDSPCPTTGSNYGYRDPDKDFITTMSYGCGSSTCTLAQPEFNPGANGSCLPINRFSTPDSAFNYNGKAIGSDSANCAATIANVVPTVADFFNPALTCDSDDDCENVFGCPGTCDTENGYCIENCGLNDFSLFSIESCYNVAPNTCWQRRGTMFDIQSTKALTLEGIGPNVLSSGAGEVAIYTKSGTHVGFENDASAWTLIAVRSFQNAAQTYFFFDEPIELGPGSTQAFYVRIASGVANLLYYEGGSGINVGDVFFASDDLIVKWGTRNDGLFGTFHGPAALWNSFLYKSVQNSGLTCEEAIEFESFALSGDVFFNWTFTVGDALDTCQDACNSCLSSTWSPGFWFKITQQNSDTTSPDYTPGRVYFDFHVRVADGFDASPRITRFVGNDCSSIASLTEVPECEDQDGLGEPPGDGRCAFSFREPCPDDPDSDCDTTACAGIHGYDEPPNFYFFVRTDSTDDDVEFDAFINLWF